MGGKRYYIEDKQKLKTIGYIAGIVLLVSLIALIFVLSLYQNKVDADTQIAAQKMNEIESEIIESTTASDDKTINEVKENLIVESIEIEKTEPKKKTENSNKKTVKEEPLEFCVPVEGDIIRDYADSNLIYSETLEEWTTHYGIDIRAEKGSAVSASEKGIIKSIKDDPRYGLTVTIEHKDGFETIYSNLLSAEFIKEGDEVEKGQTIGTVGESAIFEIVDEPHLHFEMLLNSSNVNPSTYWK